jgi:hypothetical protein
MQKQRIGEEKQTWRLNLQAAVYLLYILVYRIVLEGKLQCKGLLTFLYS